ncbi:GFA family protein [Arenibaculum pallidiluteum]|uniref:GFA family protein n=1 Tax=Arenibaculum pallidiluteum TaxID=2812559 RepID=UPI001A96510E|nr:GFA family protein [Arenibaculum pallidiluteum]
MGGDPIRHRGRCACGAVSYEASGLRDAALCSCETCRRASGAGAVAWVVADRDTLVVRGELGTFRSSDHAERRHCRRCGSQLFLLEDDEPGNVEIAAGTLDEPEAARPEAHIWTRGRPSWAAPGFAVREYEQDR